MDQRLRERREHIRIITSKGVDFVVRGRLYRGLIENKSHGGVFIKTEGRFSDRYEGQGISMAIESPQFGSEKRTGKIVRITPEGIGVEFSHPGYTR